MIQNSFIQRFCAECVHVKTDWDCIKLVLQSGGTQLVVKRRSQMLDADVLAKNLVQDLLILSLVEILKIKLLKIVAQKKLIFSSIKWNSV